MKRITTILAISLFLLSQKGWSQDCDSIFIIPSIEVISNNTPTIIENPLGNINYYDICLNEKIDFSGSWKYKGEQNPQDAEDEVFTWNHLIDGTLFSDQGQFYSPIFTQRGIHEISLNITDNNNCNNKIIEKIYVRVSHVETSELFVDPSIVCIDIETEIEAGIRPSISVIPMNTENKFPTQTIIQSGPACPKNVFEEAIQVNSFLPNQSLNQVNDFGKVCMNIEHSRAQDLTIELIAPNGGKVILLRDENGVGEGNGGNDLGLFPKLGTPNEIDSENCEQASNLAGIGSTYCWSPDPTDGTWHDLEDQGQLVYPFNHEQSYVIKESNIEENKRIYSAYDNTFNNILNTELNGDWTLKIEDIQNSKNGYIFEWWIEFDQAITPSNLTFKPQASTFKWFSEDSLVSTTNTTLFESSIPGTFKYDMNISDSFGCEYDGSVEVTVPTRLELLSKISIPDSCEKRIGKVAVEGIGGTKPYEYFWNTIGKMDSTVSYLRSGTYPYIITDATNCTFEGEVIVEDRSKQVEALFSHELDTCTSELNLINESTNLLNNIWNYQTAEPNYEKDLIVPNLGGIYNIELIASNEHCADTVSSTIDLTGTDAYSRVKFPNVFTPNEDGINDLLSIYGLRDCETGSLKIFNKWGDEVYYSIFPGRYLWDGKRFDEELSEGTYFYVLKLNHAEFKGAFSLFR